MGIYLRPAGFPSLSLTLADENDESAEKDSQKRRQMRQS